ncbi:MAG: hypothetical protein ACJZ9F_07475 [Rhodospirillaceae bacterium]
MRTRFSKIILALAGSFVWLHSTCAKLLLVRDEFSNRLQSKKNFLAGATGLNSRQVSRQARGLGVQAMTHNVEPARVIGIADHFDAADKIFLSTNVKSVLSNS